MEEFDKELEEFLAKVGLLHETCHLNHGQEKDIPQAVDYLCQYVGPTDSNVVESLLRIPVCAECILALYDEDWLLFYCLHCNESQWIIKSKAKKYYPKEQSVIFLTQCPNCASMEEYSKDVMDK